MATSLVLSEVFPVAVDLLSQENRMCCAMLNMPEPIDLSSMDVRFEEEAGMGSAMAAAASAAELSGWGESCSMSRATSSASSAVIS